jgi:tetratricopeptide (TPR) repeat protein
LVKGKIGYAELFNITVGELYAIAQIGYNYMLSGKLEEACTIYEGLVVLRPEDPYFRMTLGNIYLNKGMIKEAIESYDKALDILPDFITALVNRGLAYFIAADYQKAKHDFKRAIDKAGERDDVLKAKIAELLHLVE